MAKRKGKADNFKPLTTEEARRRGRAGGLASVKARLEKKNLRQWALILRDAESAVIPNMTRGQAAIAAAWTEAENGNIRAHRFLGELLGELDGEAQESIVVAPPVILGMIPQDMVDKAKADHERRQLENDIQG